MRTLLVLQCQRLHHRSLLLLLLLLMMMSV
jgi:hypothetical protein